MDFCRAFAGAIAALGVLIGSADVHAAGALAIGECGAYGFAYDYSREAAAGRAALGKCKGGCKVVALSLDTMPAVRTAMRWPRGSAMPRIRRCGSATSSGERTASFAPGPATPKDRIEPCR